MGKKALRQGVGVIAITAVFLAIAWTVSAAATYDSTCNASGDACLWKHGPFVVPLAATTSSDSTYADDTWPNSTSSLNNSASSLKNKFDVKDVIWFTLTNYGGLSKCLDHETSAGTLNSDFNDKLSSHAVVVGSTC